MVTLTIDDVTVRVPAGTSLLGAAATVGIVIPTLCHLEGHGNHPSCMVCLVRDIGSGRLVPSCAMPAEEGMCVDTASEEVTLARRTALGLLLSDHSGDCEAPCRVSCPAFMDIPLMNRLIADSDFQQALRVVREEIALPAVLGYICPAPCEKACKRKPIDGAVSICLLKRFAAENGLPGFAGENQASIQLPAPTGRRVAVVGAGPAGLAAACYLLRKGHTCVIYDRAGEPGGALRYELPRDRLPLSALESDIDVIRAMGAEFRMNCQVTAGFFRDSLLPGYDAVILATGLPEPDPAGFGLSPGTHGGFVNRHHWTTSLPGVFGCGGMAGTLKMAVQAVAQGKAAALQADRYLRSGAWPAFDAPSPDPVPKSVSTTGHLDKAEWPQYLQEALPDGRAEPAGGWHKGFSREEAIREAGRCMHCDCRKPVSCKLRSCSEHYHVHRKRTHGHRRSPVSRILQHDLLVYESEKCIRCGLCVEISARFGETFGMAYDGRGFDVRIRVPFGQTPRDGLTRSAAACVEACPTGALAWKEHEERNSP